MVVKTFVHRFEPPRWADGVVGHVANAVTVMPLSLQRVDQAGRSMVDGIGSTRAKAQPNPSAAPSFRRRHPPSALRRGHPAEVEGDVEDLRIRLCDAGPVGQHHVTGFRTGGRQAGRTSRRC